MIVMVIVIVGVRTAGRGRTNGSRDDAFEESSAIDGPFLGFGHVPPPRGSDCD